MEARSIRFALGAVLVFGLLASTSEAARSRKARFKTANYLVEHEDAGLAKQVAQRAETYRKVLAETWLGKTLPNWSSPCLITLRVGAVARCGWGDVVRLRSGRGLRLADVDPRFSPTDARFGFAA